VFELGRSCEITGLEHVASHQRIGRWKRRWKAEEASEAEAEFETERRGGRGFPLHHQETTNMKNANQEVVIYRNSNKDFVTISTFDF